MYNVDDQDQVVVLVGVPRCSTGAPLPLILAGEGTLLLGYVASTTEPNVANKIDRSALEHSIDSRVAIIKFESPLAHFFGPPNDEAIHGHPLAARGLGPYGAFEIVNSSWVRELERMNSVHPSHDRELFLSGRRHFAFTFHDSTFECVAESCAIYGQTGSIYDALELMSKVLVRD